MPKTLTEAKRSLGQYLKQAAAGEEIGIVSGADIISLRKVEVIPADRLAPSVVREAAPTDVRDSPVVMRLILRAVMIAAPPP